MKKKEENKMANKKRVSPRVKRKPAQKSCDYGHFANRVHRLDTGGGSGLFLCREHWNKEMAWRKSRNADLKKSGHLTKSSRFNIRKWRAR